MLFFFCFYTLTSGKENLPHIKKRDETAPSCTVILCRRESWHRVTVVAVIGARIFMAYAVGGQEKEGGEQKEEEKERHRAGLPSWDTQKDWNWLLFQGEKKRRKWGKRWRAIIERSRSSEFFSRLNFSDLLFSPFLLLCFFARPEEGFSFSPPPSSSDADSLAGDANSALCEYFIVKSSAPTCSFILITYLPNDIRDFVGSIAPET